MPHHPTQSRWRATGALLLLSALALLTALTLAACGSSRPATTSSHHATTTSHRATTSTTATPAASGHVGVAIQSYAFKPAVLTVRAGTRVTFTNRDATAHTATSTRAGVFDSGTVAPGQSASVTLTKPGIYSYYCQFHAFMKATVIVK
jgi:plastocyanin